MVTEKKNQRIEMRVSKTQKLLLEKASDAMSMSVSEFMLQISLERVSRMGITITPPEHKGQEKMFE
jgi:uncharacterized protein (DUF1778 family)